MSYLNHDLDDAREALKAARAAHTASLKLRRNDFAVALHAHHAAAVAQLEERVRALRYLIQHPAPEAHP